MFFYLDKAAKTYQANFSNFIKLPKSSANATALAQQGLQPFLAILAGGVYPGWIAHHTTHLDQP